LANPDEEDQEERKAFQDRRDRRKVAMGLGLGMSGTSQHRYTTAMSSGNPPSGGDASPVTSARSPVDDVHPMEQTGQVKE